MEAINLFDKVKSEGVVPTSFLYNTLIEKLSKAHHIDDCLFYFSEIWALDICPTSVTYDMIVNTLCHISDEWFTEELFMKMEAMLNYKLCVAPYNFMIQFFIYTKWNHVKVLIYYDCM